MARDTVMRRANRRAGKWETANMKRHTREGGLRTPFAQAILVLAMAAMSAAVAQQKTTVVLGTATQGGGFQIYGAAYSAALDDAEATLAIEQHSTTASTENAPLLASVASASLSAAE